MMLDEHLEACKQAYKSYTKAELIGIIASKREDIDKLHDRIKKLEDENSELKSVDINKTINYHLYEAWKRQMNVQFLEKFIVEEILSKLNISLDNDSDYYSTYIKSVLNYKDKELSSDSVGI